MTETEDIVRALEVFSSGEQPDRPSIKLLHERGYITVSDVINLRSREREYLAISITKNGRELLELWKKK